MLLVADPDCMGQRTLITGFIAIFSSWSLAGVVLSMAHFGPAALMWQASISAIAFIALIVFREMSLSWKHARKAFLHSVTRVAGLCCFLYAFLYIEIGVVDTIIACGVFLSVFFFARRQGESPHPTVIYFLVSAIFGIILVCQINKPTDILSLEPGLIAAFGAMFFISLSNYLWRKSSRGIDTTEYLMYMHVWVAIVSLPVILALQHINVIHNDLIPSATQLGFLLGSVIIGSCGDIAFTRIQKHSTYIINAVFSPAGAIFSPIFGFLLKGETLEPIQITGIGIIAVSVACASYLQARPSKNATPLLEPSQKVRVNFLALRRKHLWQR